MGDRARARQVMCWLRTSHDPLRRERPIEHLVYRRHDDAPPLSPPAQRAAADLVRAAARLGANASGALFGTFSIVDVDLAFALWRLRGTTFLTPPLSAYVDAVLARPSVREFIDHPRPPYLPAME
jgi:glutathione S-transferase